MNYDKICYGCFREKNTAGGICPYCGYSAGEEQPANTLPAGAILNGRYLIGKVLGVGGFGATYLTFDMKLEEKCACKEYLPSGMAVRRADHYTLAVARSENRAPYENGMEKFLNEARILVRLKDVPNIVSVRDFFQENGTAYFVMQFIEGKSLKDLLKARGGRLSFTEAMQVLLPIMRALQQVHAKQLLHRDISPDNIYLTKRNVPILLDFGAARSSAGDASTMSVILKHGYAPIEQYSSHGNQGPWTDVYAMGATLYHCLTGQLPPNAVDRLRSDGLARPSALGVQIPPAAENALIKALAVRTEDRWTDMGAFAGALLGRVPGTAQGNAGAARWNGVSQKSTAASQQPNAQWMQPQAGAQQNPGARQQNAPWNQSASRPGAPWSSQSGPQSGTQWNQGPQSGTQWNQGRQGGTQWNPQGAQPSSGRKKLSLPVLLGIVGAAAAAVIIIVVAAVNSSQKSSGIYDYTSASGTVSPQVTPEPVDTASPEPTAAPEPEVTPEPTLTYDPEEYEVYGESDSGITFHYIDDESQIFIASEYYFGSAYKAALIMYGEDTSNPDVEIDVLRMGSEFGDSYDVLQSVRENFENSGFHLVGDSLESAMMGDNFYYYCILQEGDSDTYFIPYTMDVGDEVILIIDGIFTTPQMEEAQQQLAMIASTVELQ